MGPFVHVNVHFFSAFRALRSPLWQNSLMTRDKLSVAHHADIALMIMVFAVAIDRGRRTARAFDGIRSATCIVLCFIFHDYILSMIS
jgi:hypothetical protein